MWQCRNLLSDVAANAQLRLDEDAATVRLLISGMYDANCPVSWDTLADLLELARKYDVDDIQLNCERFLDAEELTTCTLPLFIALACTFGMDAAIERCQEYIATPGHFNKIAE